MLKCKVPCLALGLRKQTGLCQQVGAELGGCVLACRSLALPKPAVRREKGEPSKKDGNSRFPTPGRDLVLGLRRRVSPTSPSEVRGVGRWL